MTHGNSISEPRESRPGTIYNCRREAGRRNPTPQLRQSFAHGFLASGGQETHLMRAHIYPRGTDPTFQSSPLGREDLGQRLDN